MPKVFVPSTINVFTIYLEGGLETPPEKEQKQGKSVCKTTFHMRDWPEKSTETMQSAEMKERKKTTLHV